MPDPPKSAAELLERYKHGERGFIGADLREVELSGANLSSANLIRANLRRANLCDASLSNANLGDATLSGANLSGASLSGANLSDANLNAYLHGAGLIRANLSDANLRGADLSRAKLGDADLSRANLSRARFSGANLSGANLGRAKLSDANLSGANLSGANLSGANLSGANLSGANFGWTLLGNLNLSQVKGLDTVEHLGPSTVGIDTIHRSSGRIPEAFLRGCGVPDTFITYVASLVGRPFEFYSCFISYSSKDEEFAKRLHARLQQEGLRVWFAPEEMQGGRKLHEQIDEAIRLYDKLLLILSPASMSSLWVQREILKARQKEEREKRRVLFPIRLCSFDELRDWECLDSDTGLDLARRVRSYFIPDFSAWKDHDAFAAGAARLIKDLRAEAQGAQAPASAV